MLSTRQAAAVLGVHERTVRRYLAAGALAHRRLPGGHYRIPTDAIEALWSSPPAEKQARSARNPAPASSLATAHPPHDLSPAVLASLRSRFAPENDPPG